MDALKLANGVCSETWLQDLKQSKTGAAQKQVWVCIDVSAKVKPFLILHEG